MNENLERFLRYVKIDTQSNSESDTVPSASKELNLTRLLQKELSEMGIDSEIDEYGILYGHLDGEDDLEPIGLNSHVDTAEELSGANVNPRIVKNYDGGVINSQKAIAREQGKVQSAQTEVNLYGVRKRVNEMYFSLLMLDEQIQLNRDLQELLSGNERKLKSMVKGGTAAESDWLNVKAERLNVVQQATNLQSQRRMLQTMLSTFCGIEVKNVQKPVTATQSEQAGQRPEMRLFDAQLQLANAQEKALDASLMPKVGVFAQGYYGYPGYNMFEDMISHKWSLNGMIGARLTWNIGALYTRKNDKAKIQLQRDLTESNREVFLFNNNLEQIQQNEEIDRYKKMMADDEEIISLRSAVRKAAESKLAHGIIDVNDLLREINQENAARVQQSMHEIEMLKEIYDLRFSRNDITSK